MRRLGRNDSAAPARRRAPVVRPLRLTPLACALALVSLATSVAVPETRAETSEEAVARLEARVAELEAENRALREALGRLPEPAEERAAEERDLANENRALREALARSDQSNERLAEQRTQLQRLAGLPSADDLEARIVAEFDRETDTTTVTARSIVIPESAAGLAVPHRLGARFAFEGEAPPARVDVANIVIVTVGNTNDRYRKLESLTLVADGESHALPVVDYEITRRTGSRISRSKNLRYDERIVAAIDYDTLRQVTEASGLRLKMQRTDLALTPAHTALLGALRAHMRTSPAGGGP